MKKTLLFLIFFPIFLCSQSKRDLKKYNNIVKLIEQNNLDLAISKTWNLLEGNDEWKKPNLLLSRIKFIQGDLDEGEMYFLKYYSLKSKKNSRPIFNLALKFYKNGIYNKALKYFIISRNLSDDESEFNRYINNCEFALKSIANPVNFKFQNLGENVNTNNAEYLPFISVNDQTLIFTRLIPNTDGKYQEDFYFSEKTNNKWNKSNEMEINTPGNEGSICISPNQKYLIYTACDRVDTKGSCDLYLCVKKTDGTWGKEQNLSSINSRNWESQPFFSPDMRYLYFVSNRRGGFGGNDIWRSEITKFGFSEPENLGATINTKYNEMSPFLHPDNLTFYFSSEGHIGMGDFDLFVSKRKHSDTSWNIVENMGYPINTFNTENSLAVSPDGMIAYFVSDREGFGKEDIFSFELPLELRAEKLSELEINIISKNDGNEIILENVLFETDSYKLIPNSFDELKILFYFLQKNPSVKILIEGHTDNVGDTQYNFLLSKNRAKEVYKYLKSMGISEYRLSYKGYGESRPIVSNNTELGRSKNRRTSFIIIE